MSAVVTTNLKLAMSPTHVWDLLCSERAQRQWLGIDGRFPTVSGVVGSIELLDGSTASLVAISAGNASFVELTARVLTATATCRLTLDASGGATVLRFESDPVGEVGTAVGEAFDQALGRLKVLIRDINRRRGSPRQAVVVIHGIGNQEPGSTLRSFVDEVMDGRDRYSKPDRRSRSFDLRRVHLPPTGSSPMTDVFEMYWAHLMTDTTVAQVTAWARPLLRKRVPKRFAMVRLGLIVFLVVAAGSIVAALIWGNLWPRLGAIASLVVSAVGIIWRWLVRGPVVSSVGDAARYLTPKPSNIANRQLIRQAGVDLLRGLHDGGEYDRIVVVGHSLGSVIAYDMLSFYWIEAGSDFSTVTPQRDNALRRCEKAIAGKSRIDDPQALQASLWNEQRSNGRQWLVTDLVTVGSPLSMADFLMAASVDELESKQAKREYPTCPPKTERFAVGPQTRHQRISYDEHVATRDGDPKVKVSTLHHAALFGMIRWTNLHFPVKLIKGDPIGGPVKPLFGDWVRDVAIDRPASPKRGLHSMYWRPTTPQPGNPSSIELLRAALKLECVRELRTMNQSWSPLVHLPKGENHDR